MFYSMYLVTILVLNYLPQSETKVCSCLRDVGENSNIMITLQCSTVLFDSHLPTANIEKNKNIEIIVLLHSSRV